MSSNNNAIATRLSRKLQLYKWMLEEAYRLGINADKFYIGGEKTIPKKYMLKFRDVRDLEKGKKKSLNVIEPQDYDKVSVLDLTDNMMQYRQWVGYNYAKSCDLATSGSGSNPWIVVSPAFRKWFDKKYDKLEALIKKKEKIFFKKAGAAATVTQHNKKSINSDRSSAAPKYRSGVNRPSARAMYNAGKSIGTKAVYADGTIKYLAVRIDGTPFLSTKKPLGKFALF